MTQSKPIRGQEVNTLQEPNLTPTCPHLAIQELQQPKHKEPLGPYPRPWFMHKMMVPPAYLHFGPSTTHRLSLNKKEPIFTLRLHLPYMKGFCCCCCFRFCSIIPNSTIVTARGILSTFILCQVCTFLLSLCRWGDLGHGIFGMCCSWCFPVVLSVCRSSGTVSSSSCRCYSRPCPDTPHSVLHGTSTLSPSLEQL